MKNIGALVTVAVMLLAGLVAFVLWGPFGEKPGLREAPVEGVQPVAEAPQGVPAKEKPPTVRSSGRAGGDPSEETAQPPAAAPVPPSAPASPKPEKRFPRGNEIAVGTDKAALQATFGKPMMRTTVVDSGRLLETWVYLQSDPNLATFVLIRNGRVASANTTVY
jgi:hypothetical protein